MTLDYRKYTEESLHDPGHFGYYYKTQVTKAKRINGINIKLKALHSRGNYNLDN